MDKIREIFWTGGWDSTFRLIQLSRYFSGEVQPVYISGDNRKSEKIELETMYKILRLLMEHPETKATILPIKIVDKKDLCVNQEITDAYHAIRKKIKIGSQYEFLARYAIEHPYVEIGPECPDGEFSGIVEAIEEYGKLIKFGDDSWALDPEHSTKECMLLFGNYSYPLIKTTEREMLALIKNWGYEDIMSHIWFCHSPISNLPCGMCRPCEQKMDEHMEFLLPKVAQRRYRTLKFLRKIFGNKVNGIYRRIILLNVENKNKKH